MRWLWFCLLLSQVSVASESSLTELTKSLNTLSQRLDQQRVEITPQQFRWQEWERFEQELNFVVAHDPVGEAESVPDELQSGALNQRLYARWDELVLSATQLQLTQSNPVWTELEESMKRFFQHREKQLYRLARAQMKSGEIRDSLMELLDQAAKRSTAGLSAPQVRVQVLDPALLQAGQELKKIAQKLQAPQGPERSGVTVSAVELTLALGAFLLVSVLAVWGWVRRPATRTVTVEVPAPAPRLEDLRAQLGSPEQWMKQLEGTLNRQQTLEVQQETELRQARQLVQQLQQAISAFKNAQAPQELYLNLEKIEIATQAIEAFVAKQDPLLFAEVPYLLTKLILSMSETVEQRQRKTDVAHAFS